MSKITEAAALYNNIGAQTLNESITPEMVNAAGQKTLEAITEQANTRVPALSVTAQSDLDAVRGIAQVHCMGADGVGFTGNTLANFGTRQFAVHCTVEFDYYVQRSVNGAGLRVKRKLLGNQTLAWTDWSVDSDIDKVDKVTGKGLSTNDYTTSAAAEVAKVANKADYANPNFTHAIRVESLNGIAVDQIGNDEYQMLIGDPSTKTYIQGAGVDLPASTKVGEILISNLVEKHSTDEVPDRLITENEVAIFNAKQNGFFADVTIDYWQTETPESPFPLQLWYNPTTKAFKYRYPNNTWQNGTFVGNAIYNGLGGDRYCWNGTDLILLDTSFPFVFNKYGKMLSTNDYTADEKEKLALLHKAFTPTEMNAVITIGIYAVAYSSQVETPFSIMFGYSREVGTDMFYIVNRTFRVDYLSEYEVVQFMYANDGNEYRRIIQTYQGITLGTWELVVVLPDVSSLIGTTIEIGTSATTVKIGDSAVEVSVGTESPWLFLGDNALYVTLGDGANEVNIARSSPITIIAESLTGYTYIGQENVELNIGQWAEYIYLGQEAYEVHIGNGAGTIKIGDATGSGELLLDASHAHLEHNALNIINGYTAGVTIGSAGRATTIADTLTVPAKSYPNKSILFGTGEDDYIYGSSAGIGFGISNSQVAAFSGNGLRINKTTEATDSVAALYVLGGAYVDKKLIVNTIQSKAASTLVIGLSATTLRIGESTSTFELGLNSSSFSIGKKTGVGATSVSVGESATALKLGENSTTTSIGKNATTLNIGEGFLLNTVNIGLGALAIHIGETASNIRIGYQASEVRIGTEGTATVFEVYSETAATIGATGEVYVRDSYGGLCSMTKAQFNTWLAA